MALNIKDPETEQLAAEVAGLTGQSKTGAVREALRDKRDQLVLQTREEHRLLALRRLLDDEIWPLIPPDQLGRPIPKEEQDDILGFGPDGA